MFRITRQTANEEVFPSYGVNTITCTLYPISKSITTVARLPVLRGGTGTGEPRTGTGWEEIENHPSSLSEIQTRDFAALLKFITSC